MRLPAVPEKPVRLLRLDEVRKPLADCRGSESNQVRDRAIIRLLLDCGIGAHGLSVADLDFEQDIAIVIGKGWRA
jgi:site-specific recombinase XerD